GVIAGENLITQMQSGKVVLSEGESIKIVAHSQGAAYAAGMASAIAKNSKYGSLLEFVDYLSPHQPTDFNHPDNIKGRQYSTKSAKVSSKGNWFYGRSTYRKIPGTACGEQRELLADGFGG